MIPSKKTQLFNDIWLNVEYISYQTTCVLTCSLNRETFVRLQPQIIVFEHTHTIEKKVKEKTLKYVILND